MKKVHQKISACPSNTVDVTRDELVAVLASAQRIAESSERMATALDAAGAKLEEQRAVAEEAIEALDRLMLAGLAIGRDAEIDPSALDRRAFCEEAAELRSVLHLLRELQSALAEVVVRQAPAAAPESHAKAA